MLDIAPGWPVAGFAACLGGLEEYPPTLLSVRDAGVWERLLEQLITEPDYEWRMIDASYIKAHAAGAVGGNQAMGRTKGGSIQSCTWPGMRMVCHAERLLLQVPRRIVNLLVH